MWEEYGCPTSSSYHVHNNVVQNGVGCAFAVNPEFTLWGNSVIFSTDLPHSTGWLDDSVLMRNACC